MWTPQDGPAARFAFWTAEAASEVVAVVEAVEDAGVDVQAGTELVPIRILQ